MGNAWVYGHLAVGGKMGPNDVDVLQVVLARSDNVDEPVPPRATTCEALDYAPVDF